MKKSVILVGALLVAVASFGQKKEIKKAQKAFVKGDADVGTNVAEILQPLNWVKQTLKQK